MKGGKRIIGNRRPNWLIDDDDDDDNDNDNDNELMTSIIMFLFRLYVCHLKRPSFDILLDRGIFCALSKYDLALQYHRMVLVMMVPAGR